jgi:hypothetical protein
MLDCASNQLIDGVGKTHVNLSPRSWQAGDIIGLLLDLNKGSIKITVNGGTVGKDPAFDARRDIAIWNECGIIPCAYLSKEIDEICRLHVNFGQEPFVYAEKGTISVFEACHGTPRPQQKGLVLNKVSIIYI